jgi:hypothetical protein
MKQGVNASFFKLTHYPRTGCSIQQVQQDAAGVSL